MAKLFAEITSEKGGRITSKGGNDFVSVKLTQNNKVVASITMWQGRLQVLLLDALHPDEKGNPTVTHAESFQLAKANSTAQVCTQHEAGNCTLDCKYRT